MGIQITSFDTLTPEQLEDAARVLMIALEHAPSAWHDMPSARAEVATFVGAQERRAFAALDGKRLVAWIGAITQSTHAWELHPLVVDPSMQAKGCGAMLVDWLEEVARQAGACTIWLGSDDDFGGTNLYGVDLYPNVLEKLSKIEVTEGHPFTFYQAKGYCIVGVIPDADGIGKPDILMAKRLVELP